MKTVNAMHLRDARITLHSREVGLFVSTNKSITLKLEADSPQEIPKTRVVVKSVKHRIHFQNN